MNKWEAQQEFWGSFGIPAYDEQTIFTEGDQPALPHITYQSFGGNLGQTVTLSASLWYKSTKMRDIKAKADEIEKYIKQNEPLVFPLDHGYLWIKVPTDTPFAQPIGSENDKTNRVVLTVEAECLTAW